MGVSVDVNRYEQLHGSLKVLFADDDRIILEAASEQLAKNPLYRIDCVSTAEDADRKIQDTPYHCAILDMRMKHPQGQYFLLKKYGRILPTVVYSAMDEEAVKSDCSALGAIAFMGKGTQSTLELKKSLDKAALTGILRCADREGRRVVESALAKRPSSIEQWAQNADLTQKDLKTILARAFKARPKHIHFAICFYCAALEYFTNDDMAAWDARKYRKRNIYYENNKKILHELLARSSLFAMSMVKNAQQHYRTVHAPMPLLPDIQFATNQA